MSEEHQGLTPEEEVYYSNYALIDLCDECGDYFPIHNHHDNAYDFLTWANGRLYCQGCLKWI